MGVEDEIRSLLGRGYSPQEIIRQGYKKSTVYKIHSDFVPQTVPVAAPPWAIYSQLDKPRYLPGDTSAIRYSITNRSGMDLYISQTGIQPEWLFKEASWHAQEGRFLLHPGEKSRELAINVPVPPDIPLGEYEMRWGLELQFVGPGVPILGSTYQTQWSDPFLLEVKKTAGYSVFISHSTQDMRLVRQLQKALDLEGIETIVAEDSVQPGAMLREKFEAQIRECQFFLALLTEHGASSEWVIHETNYALQIRKPAILLKEKEIGIESNVEWVEFSRYDPPERIMEAAIDAVDKAKARLGWVASPNLAPIVVGALGFLVGLAAAKSNER